MDTLKREKEMRMRVFKNKPIEFWIKIEEINEIIEYINTLRRIAVIAMSEENK